MDEAGEWDLSRAGLCRFTCWPPIRGSASHVSAAVHFVLHVLGWTSVSSSGLSGVQHPGSASCGIFPYTCPFKNFPAYSQRLRIRMNG